MQYGEEMRAAGLIDPYIELTEPPAAASRWRPGGYRTRQRDKGTGGIAFFEIIPSDVFELPRNETSGAAWSSVQPRRKYLGFVRHNT